MTSCVRIAPMIGSRPGELPAEDARALAAHLETCASCRALSASFAVTDGLVAEALLARANARDFAPFVDQVMARVGHRSPRASQRTDRRSLLDSLRERWRIAVPALVAAAVLAAVGSFMYRGEHVVTEPERLLSMEIELSGSGSTVIQTPDGPIVLIALEDDKGS